MARTPATVKATGAYRWHLMALRMRYESYHCAR